MSNLSAHAFRITTSGEQLRSLINLRIGDIERQHNIVATAMSEAREHVAELEKAATERVSQLREQLDMRHRNRLDNSSGIGMSEIAAARDRLVRLEDSAAELGLLRKQSLWLHDQVVPSSQYELDAHDLMMFGFVRSQANIGDLVAPRY